ncbi:RNA polymerase factor sigma-54 [bacterium]|nr:RNA polymerase factor sigma-54 [bacterium]
MVKAELELRPKLIQKLRLAPQIRQTLALLPLSNIELAHLIRKELGENPLLEEGEESPTRLPARQELEEIEAPKVEEKEATLDWVEYLEDYERGAYPTQERREPFPLEKLVTRKPTLSEHLLRQLRLSTPLEAGPVRGRSPQGGRSRASRLVFDESKRVGRAASNGAGRPKAAVARSDVFSEGRPLTGSTSDRMVLKIGEQIIGNLDRNGYLKTPLGEIASTLKMREKEVAKVLGLIQTFDPIGVGARDVKECLLIQIRRRTLRKPLVYRIIKEHLEDLGKRRYREIAKALKVRVEKVQEAADFIATLEPKPGRSFGEESVQAVIPDVTVTKVDKEYVLVLNNEGLLRLQISPLYKKMLAKGSRINKEEEQYIKDRLNAAIGLIKAIDQREKTIYKITESIIKVQGDFLEKGIDYLKPLTLKKIARDVGMHESTVSRTTSNKYIQTSQGVFELKYFFTSGFGKSSVRPTVEGGKETTSSRSIKEAIKDLIDSEDAKKPLSDQKIANIFTINLGIDIARRTVTKYREEMRILPSHQRKRY